MTYLTGLPPLSRIKYRHAPGQRHGGDKSQILKANRSVFLDDIDRDLYRRDGTPVLEPAQGIAVRGPAHARTTLRGFAVAEVRDGVLQMKTEPGLPAVLNRRTMFARRRQLMIYLPCRRRLRQICRRGIPQYTIGCPSHFREPVHISARRTPMRAAPPAPRSTVNARYVSCVGDGLTLRTSSPPPRLASAPPWVRINARQ